jgi:hypothetical protein
MIYISITNVVFRINHNIIIDTIVKVPSRGCCLHFPECKSSDSISGQL